MKFLKNIVLLLVTSASILAQSSYYSATNLAATNTVAVNSPALLESIILTSTNTLPTLVQLFDGNLTYTTGAYTNYISYTTNVVSTYISVLGTTNTMTNTVLWNQLDPHAAATNNRTASLALMVNPASQAAVTYTPPTAIVFSSKINLSNNLAGVNVVLRYRLP
jgi:hypothetical protein